MNKKELLELIEKIGISKSDFTVLSSGGLVIRGILDIAHDLDIGVTKKGLEGLKNIYDLKQKDNGWYIVNDQIECVEDSMIGRRELVDGCYVQDIYNYLEYLEGSKREKDKLRIPKVKEYISKMKK